MLEGVCQVLLLSTTNNRGCGLRGGEIILTTALTSIVVFLLKDHGPFFHQPAMLGIVRLPWVGPQGTWCYLGTFGSMIQSCRS